MPKGYPSRNEAGPFAVTETSATGHGAVTPSRWRLRFRRAYGVPDLLSDEVAVRLITTHFGSGEIQEPGDLLGKDFCGVVVNALIEAAATGAFDYYLLSQPERVAIGPEASRALDDRAGDALKEIATERSLSLPATPAIGLRDQTKRYLISASMAMIKHVANAVPPSHSRPTSALLWPRF